MRRHVTTTALLIALAGCRTPSQPSPTVITVTPPSTPTPAVVAPQPVATTPTTTVTVPSAAAGLAAQEGLTLWSGVQPGGTSGHAVLGDNWTVHAVSAWDTGVVFVSPTLDELQVFDLIDRGMDPQNAIDWMHANGYSTIADWYASVAVIGFSEEYLALIDGAWSVVVKVGA